MTGLRSRQFDSSDATVDVWNREGRTWETVSADGVIEVKPDTNALDPFLLNGLRICVGALFGLLMILAGTILVKMIMTVWKGMV